MSETWLGHRDLCSLQWSSICNCDPDNPIDFSEPDTCRTVEVDGESIRVYGGGEMDETDRMHFAEIVRAAKRRYESEHPPESAREDR